MTKFLVVFDVDSTLIEDEAIELLAQHAGTYEQVAEVTERAMRGEIDFAQSLHERVATLAGLSEAVLGTTATQLRPTTGAAELIAEIHRRGGMAAAVSGGFNQLLDPLQEKLNLDLAMANTLELEDGQLTGRVSGEIIDRSAKAKYLAQWAAELGIHPKQTIAVGDGANDLEMMAAAGLSVAFCAKPVVQERADITIGDRDLRNLLALLP